MISPNPHLTKNAENFQKIDRTLWLLRFFSAYCHDHAGIFYRSRQLAANGFNSVVAGRAKLE